MLKAMPRQKKAEALVHGQKKASYQFLLTPEASEEIDKIAKELNISRSELLERVIRAGGLHAAFHYAI